VSRKPSGNARDRPECYWALPRSWNHRESILSGFPADHSAAFWSCGCAGFRMQLNTTRWRCSHNSRDGSALIEPHELTHFSNASKIASHLDKKTSRSKPARNTTRRCSEHGPALWVHGHSVIKQGRQRAVFRCQTQNQSNSVRRPQAVNRDHRQAGK